MNENKLADVGWDIFRNKILTDGEITAIKYVAEDIRQGKEEPDEENESPRIPFERLPSDMNMKRSVEINCDKADKDSETSSKETIFKDYIFTEEHRESLIERKQEILNTLAVVRNTNTPENDFISSHIQSKIAKNKN